MMTPPTLSHLPDYAVVLILLGVAFLLREGDVVRIGVEPRSAGQMME